MVGTVRSHGSVRLPRGFCKALHLEKDLGELVVRFRILRGEPGHRSELFATLLPPVQPGQEQSESDVYPLVRRRLFSMPCGRKRAFAVCQGITRTSSSRGTKRQEALPPDSLKGMLCGFREARPGFLVGADCGPAAGRGEEWWAHDAAFPGPPHFENRECPVGIRLAAFLESLRRPSRRSWGTRLLQCRARCCPIRRRTERTHRFPCRVVRGRSGAWSLAAKFSVPAPAPLGRCTEAGGFKLSAMTLCRKGVGKLKCLLGQTRSLRSAAPRNPLRGT